MNFAHGANPAREQWKEPPQKSLAQQKQTFGYFEALVRYMKTFPNVRFITGSQALDLYPDVAQRREFSSNDLATIANAVTSNVSFQEHGEYALSASEILDLLTSYVANASLKQGNGTALQLRSTPYGPSSPPPSLDRAIQVSLRQFLAAVVDVRSYVAIHHQVPSAVWLGSVPVPPEDYLVALADVSNRLLTARDLPQTLTIAPAQLAPAEHVSKDSVKLWDWPIFPEGFHSERLMELARLQAWTLKPAILASQPPQRHNSLR
jgi:hypothetical protein